MKMWVRRIEPAISRGRINPTSTLKAMIYTKKVLSFELTTNDYSLSTNLKFKFREVQLYDQIYFS